MDVDPFGEVGAFFSLQLSSHSLLKLEIKVITENQCEKHEKQVYLCLEYTLDKKEISTRYGTFIKNSLQDMALLYKNSLQDMALLYKNSLQDMALLYKNSLKDMALLYKSILTIVDVLKFQPLIACQIKDLEKLQNQIRLLLKKQSDQCLPYLLF